MNVLLKHAALVLKAFIKSLLTPDKIEKRSKFIKAVIWLGIAGVCLIGGAIVGFVSPWAISGLYLLDVWFTWSFICGIPFLNKIIKFTVTVIRGGGKFGKAIKYEETVVNQVGPPSPNYTLYEIKKEQHSLAWLFAALAGIGAFLAVELALWIGGVAALAYKTFLTVQAVINYSKESAKEDLILKV